MGNAQPSKLIDSNSVDNLTYLEDGKLAKLEYPVAVPYTVPLHVRIRMYKRAKKNEIETKFTNCF